MSTAPAAPARRRITAMRAQGFTWAHLAALTGLPEITVKRLGGRCLGGRRPPARVNGTTVAAVLGIPAATAPRRALVDATGTRRRMQALAATGWPIARLARTLGMSTADAYRITAGRQTLVFTATAERVAIAYEALWDTPPRSRTRWDTAAITHARRAAARQRWAPPAAWDDDDLDNPRARPKGMLPPPRTTDRDSMNTGSREARTDVR